MPSAAPPTERAHPTVVGASAIYALVRTWSRRVLTEGGDWLLNATVVVFSLWTVCCHATVATRGTGTKLFATAAIVFTIAVGVACAWVFRRRPMPTPDQTPVLASVPLPAESISIVGLLGAGAVIWYWVRTQDLWYFWVGSMAFLVASCALVLARSLPEQVETLGVAARKGESALLWGLAVIGAVAAAFMNRPNSDDVLYINLGVTLADHPEYVLFSRDTLHGEGMTQMYVYSVHSYELFSGALSRVTGVSALRIMHMWFTPLAGLLAALAWARLFRLIEPRRWLWLVAIVVSCYMFDGTTEQSVAGHAYMRLFQGKAVLLTVAVPLISANAIAFILHPSWIKWAILTASVIAGIGLSSTGMWLALLVGGTSLCVPITFRWSYFRTLALGLTSLIYPIVLALWMRALLHSSAGPVVEEVASTMETARAAVAGMPAILRTFGSKPLAHAYIACLLLAWPLARTALARRYVLAFTLGGFAVLVNPFLREWVADNITGHATYSRVLWYIPFSAAFALCFAGAIPESGHRLRAACGVIVTIIALTHFYTTLPGQSALAMLVYPARLKVHPEGYKISRYLVKNLDENCSVLAPVAISLVLPMLQHHPYVIMTKPKFFQDGGGMRFRLRRIVELPGPPKIGVRRRKLIAALEGYNIRGVVLNDGAAQTVGLITTLETANFTERKRFDGYRVWLRPPWSASPPK